MSEITRSPLCWPDNVPRTAPGLRGSPHFAERSLYSAARFVKAEINRVNERRWDYEDEKVIISSNLRLKLDGTPVNNQSEPADSGIAVYFTLVIRRGDKQLERPVVIACDKWRKVADNLYAIGKDIEAQRARQRWGCTNYEQAFRGYLAIPERCGGPSWWEVLGVPATADLATIETAYTRLVKKRHPDVLGGSADAFTLLKNAYNQATAQFKT